MPNKDIVDIAVIVPKEDEFRALEWAFGQELSRSDGTLPGGKLYYKAKQPVPVQGHSSELTIAFVFMNDQGNSVASSVTEQVILQLDPVLVFLSGTAAGRESKTNIGDVVIASLIVDAQEWRLDEISTPRIRHYEPPERILTDVSRFIGKSLSRQTWRDKLLTLPESLHRGENPTKELWETPPNVTVAAIGASNYLHLQPDFLRRLWDSDDRLRCIDMESGGFGSACKKSMQRQWLSVRGISDYATPASKKEAYRVAAAASAAVFLRMFIEGGLIECHPHWLRVPESDTSKLSDDNYFARFDVISGMTKHIQDALGIDLARVDLGRSLSLLDFGAICVARGADRTAAHLALAEFREQYFTDKYVNYTYENDLRGLVPHWATEVRDILGELSVDLGSVTALDVGVGNGLELPYLFSDAQRLIGVDVSSVMLQEAHKRFPPMEAVHNSAEELRDINASSIDLYISLRTYQSSLFDVPAALREAERVLRRRGVIIISIANGFVNSEGGKKKVVRGLLIPGSKVLVDRATPYKLAEQILDKLTSLGFESVGIRSGKTDIYVWGQKQ